MNNKRDMNERNANERDTIDESRVKARREKRSFGLGKWAKAFLIVNILMCSLIIANHVWANPSGRGLRLSINDLRTGQHKNKEKQGLEGSVHFEDIPQVFIKNAEVHVEELRENGEPRNEGQPENESEKKEETRRKRKAKRKYSGTAFTDEHGKFSFDLHSGTYTITVRKNNFIEHKEVVTVNGLTEKNIGLKSDDGICFLVVKAVEKETDFPLSDVQIFINQEMHTTNSEGFTELIKLNSPANYDILIRKDGYNPYKGNILVEESQHSRAVGVRLTPEAASGENGGGTHGIQNAEPPNAKARASDTQPKPPDNEIRAPNIGAGNEKQLKLTVKTLVDKKTETVSEENILYGSNAVVFPSFLRGHKITSYFVNKKIYNSNNLAAAQLSNIIEDTEVKFVFEKISGPYFLITIQGNEHHYGTVCVEEKGSQVIPVPYIDKNLKPTYYKINDQEKDVLVTDNIYLSNIRKNKTISFY